MPSEKPRSVPSKFAIYRRRKRAAGMKLVRLWVVDPAAPGFAEEAERQAAVLRGAYEEEDALDFIEKAGDFRGWTG